MPEWHGPIPVHTVDRIRVVYVEVPKAGCTSIKWALAKYRGDGRPPQGEDIHRWFGYIEARNPTQLHEWLQYRWPGWFRFTVVRDPVTRFESFYWGNKYGEEGDINRYVRRGRINEAMRHDIHAVPQTTLLGNTLSDFDFVGHTENMDEVAKVLSEAANRKVKIPHLNASPIERVPTLAATRRRLRTLYRRDMRTFGYV